MNQRLIDSGLVGEVPRGETILYSGTDPESYITEYTQVYEQKISPPVCSWKISRGVLAKGRGEGPSHTNILKNVLQKSTLPKIVKIILYYYQYKEQVDGFVLKLTFAERL